MKVIHILSEVEPFSEYHGGAISRWVGNVLYHAKQEPPSIVICPEGDGSWKDVKYTKWPALVTDYLQYGARLQHSKLWSVSILVLIKTFWNLKQLIDKGDVVYVHNRPDYVIALGILRKLWRINFPMILHLSNSHLIGEGINNRLRRKLVFHYSDRLIACSQFLIDELHLSAEQQAKTSVIPYGADDQLFYPDPDNPLSLESKLFTILFVGRLVPEKGIHVLIAALKLLRQWNLPVQLRIVGAKDFGSWSEDPYIADLRDMAEDLQEVITFVGYKAGAALAAEFRQAHLFCCPSTWDEPFGMVNVEAMASGLPVVASQVGGIPEIFSEGGGVLVPPQDPKALAEAIAPFIQNPNLRHAMAAQGRQVFQRRFIWPRVADLYVRSVRDLMSTQAVPDPDAESVGDRQALGVKC